MGNGELSEPDFNSALGTLMETLASGCSASSANDGDATFVIGNSIWVKGVKVLPEYAERMQNTYKVWLRVFCLVLVLSVLWTLGALPASLVLCVVNNALGQGL